MAAILAIIAAVAGGNLGLTATPLHPRAGARLVVGATGQVYDKGRLYLYRSSRRTCADTARGEARVGRLMTVRPIAGSFEVIKVIHPRRAGTMSICGYLYAITCDATGRDCGAA